MSKDDFKDEHVKLVKVLKKKDPKALDKERIEQQKELKEKLKKRR